MSSLATTVRLDLMSMVAVRRVMILYGVFVIVYVFLGGPEMTLPMASAGGVVASMNLFGGIEANRLTSLFGTLPVSRRTVIAAHYLVAVLSLLAAVVLSAGVSLVVAAIRHQVEFSVVPVALGTTGLMLVLLSVLIPCALRWGARSATIIVMACVLAISGSVLGVTKLVGNVPAAQGFVERVMAGGGLETWGPTGVLVLGCLAVAVSYRIAVGMYECQDH